MQLTSHSLYPALSKFWHLSMPAFALCALPSLVIAQATISTPLARFGWREQTMTLLSTGTKRRVATVEIVDLNPLCFDYTITANQAVATEQVPSFIGVLSGDKAAIDAISKTVAAGAAGALPAAARAQALPGGAAEQDFRLIRAKYDTVYQRQQQTAKGLAAIGTLRDAADKAIVAYYGVACGSSSRRGASAQESEVSWTSTKATVQKLVDQDQGLKSANADVKSALAGVDDLDSRLKSFAANHDQEYEDYRKQLEVASLLELLQLRTPSLKSDLTKLQDAVTKLGSDRDALSATVGTLSSTPHDDSRKLFVNLSGNTDSVIVTIKAIGKDGIAATKGVTHEDKFSIPIDRSFRFFVTVGLMTSRIKQSHFDRLIAQNPKYPGDSTFSTFIDRAADRVVAFAPTVVGNLTILSYHEVDFGLSTGVALRTVDDRAAPEYLMGLGISVADKAALTLGIHIGRVERLLIGNPDTVSSGPVPASITRQNAVGEQWKSAFAFAITFHR